jgi:hypothetical protein
MYLQMQVSSQAIQKLMSIEKPTKLRSNPIRPDDFHKMGSDPIRPDDFHKMGSEYPSAKPESPSPYYAYQPISPSQ